MAVRTRSLGELAHHAKPWLVVAFAVIVLAVLLSPAPAYATEYRYVAHQGKVNTKYRGNTIPAFKQAAASKHLYGIETDIYRTADGEYVCLHGEDTGLASGGKDGATWAGMNIWNTKLSKLRAKKVKGYKLPTLGEYLDICKSGGKVAFIEIKNPELSDEVDYAPEVVDEVYEHGMLGQCVFVTWIGRCRSVHLMKEYAQEKYGIYTPAHVGSGKRNERVDMAIAIAADYDLDGIGTYADIPQQEYAYEQLKDTGLQLRSTSRLRDEEHARELIEKYDLWVSYCEFSPREGITLADDGGVVAGKEQPAKDEGTADEGASEGVPQEAEGSEGAQTAEGDGSDTGDGSGAAGDAASDEAGAASGKGEDAKEAFLNEAHAAFSQMEGAVAAYCGTVIRTLQG